MAPAYIKRGSYDKIKNIKEILDLSLFLNVWDIDDLSWIQLTVMKRANSGGQKKQRLKLQSERAYSTTVPSSKQNKIINSDQ